MENYEPLGLENLGNTCFMNSALQCLARTKQLIPKLELFGSGNKLVLLVNNVDNDAQITVISESPISDNSNEGEDEDTETETDSVQQHSTEVTEEGQGDCEKESFKISMVVPAESMTGKLKHCFKAITRCQDVSPGVGSYEHRNFMSRQGGFYGYRPYDIHNLIGKHFRPGQQHDSHELLRTIVDMMKKDQTKAFRVAIMKHFGVAKNGEGSDPKMVELVKALDQKVKHKTFIDEVFGGELMTTQTCLSCRFVKRSHEEFLDLSLPIRVSKPSKDSQSGNSSKANVKKYSLFDEDDNIVINRTVEQCLQAFTEPSVLTGSNVVECENCHKINLAKVEAGANFDEIFPDAKKHLEKEREKLEKQKENASSPANQQNKSKHALKKEARKKKRDRRQQNKSSKVHHNNKIEETVEKDESQPQPGPSTSSSIALVENHFKHPSDMKNDEAHENNKEKLLKITPEQNPECLDDYVIIPSNAGQQCEPESSTHYDDTGKASEEYEHVEPDELSPIAMEQDPEQEMPTTSRKYESMEDLNRASKSDNEEAEDDDSDLPPAIDGIGHGMSDDEESNGVAPLDLLNLPGHDKFERFHLPSEDEEFEAGNASETEVEKGTTADEGFSEGENSASVENETQVPRPNKEKDNGPSDSSSRTSTSDLVFVYGSDSDENSKSSSTASATETTLKLEGIPKIPITKCPCSRQQNISRPPEFLTIHLKRFQISNRGHISKLTDHVDFPMILDLTPFCVSAEDERNIEHRKDTIFDEDGEVVYALYGIVEHSGSLHWGHYVAYVLCRPPASVSASPEETMEAVNVSSTEKEKERWYHISDSHVSPSSEYSVKNRDPYILFYERIRGEEKRKRLEKQRLLEAAKKAETAESLFSSPTTDIVNGWDESPSDPNSIKTDATSNWISNWNNTRPENDENWDEPANNSPIITDAGSEINENVGRIPLVVTDTGTCVWENQGMGEPGSSNSNSAWDTWGESNSPAGIEQNEFIASPTRVHDPTTWGDEPVETEETSQDASVPMPPPMPTDDDDCTTTKSTMLWSDLPEASNSNSETVVPTQQQPTESNSTDVPSKL